MRLPPLKAVRYFEVAARLQSFSKAAQELHVTHSAISHQIKALEDWLGQALFERQTRQVRLTEVGRRFLGPVRSAFTELSEAALAAQKYTASRPLMVTSIPSVAAKWLVPRLHKFRARHPEISVYVSATADLEPIGEGDIDIGIRFGRGVWPGLESELFDVSEVFPVASPTLIDPSKPIQKPQDILRYPLLTDSDWVHSGYDLWQDWFKAAGVEAADLRSDLSLNFSNLLVQAAIDGLGIALGNRILAGEDIKRGRLIKPVDFSVHLDASYWVVYGKNALEQPRIKAFHDWLFDEMKLYIDACA